MRYIDSNIFIYAAIGNEKSEQKAAQSKKILLAVASGKMSAATSSLTWDELVWTTKKVVGFDLAIEEGRKFLEFPNLKLLKVDDKVIYEAQKIIKNYRKKPRDAIHMACATKNKIREIVSYDLDFDGVKEAARIKPESIA